MPSHFTHLGLLGSVDELVLYDLLGTVLVDAGEARKEKMLGCRRSSVRLSPVLKRQPRYKIAVIMTSVLGFAVYLLLLEAPFFSPNLRSSTLKKPRCVPTCTPPAPICSISASR